MLSVNKFHLVVLPLCVPVLVVSRRLLPLLSLAQCFSTAGKTLLSSGHMLTNEPTQKFRDTEIDQVGKGTQQTNVELFPSPVSCVNTIALRCQLARKFIYP